MKLENTPWPEVEAEIEFGTTTVIVGTGSIEQHGPSLPLTVDTLRADALTERIADELDCFAGPPIRPGISDHHLAFSGTISLRPETFRAIVRDYCTSLETHGFEHVALVNTHGGNGDALAEVAEVLDDELSIHVFKAGSRDEFLEVRYGAMAEFGVEAAAAGAHAGAAEASFILEIARDLVRDSLLERGHVGQVDADILIENGLDSVTSNGILGDQSQASRQAGRRLIDDCVTYYADAIDAEITAAQTD